MENATEINPKIDRELKPDSQLVKKYSLFKEKLKPKSDIIYYPCPGEDISPSVAFPNSKIIYVDTLKNITERMKEKGLNAYNDSALKFNPGNVDILIMINPMISPDIPSSHLANEGYILCNNYHGTASNLKENKDYNLKAIILSSKNKEVVFDDGNLGDCWKEIDTEEEFKNSPIDFGTANYFMALRTVKEVTGKEENVLEEYKKIIEMAKKQKNNSDLDSYEQENLFFNHNGKQLLVSTTLPKKKGTVDDIFVFQKLK